jgi:hypothetical protein
MPCIQIVQMVHEVRPRRGHQSRETEQDAEGDQMVGDVEPPAHSPAHRESRTHQGSEPILWWQICLCASVPTLLTKPSFHW